MNVSHELSILERASQGDAAAFAELVRAHQASVRRYAVQLTGQEAAADDVFQDAFIAAYRGLSGFRGDASLRTWLLTITRRVAMRHGRKRAGEPDTFEDFMELGQEAGWGSEDSPEGYALRREQAADLNAALESLSELDREVITLRDLEELSTAEAAEVMDMSPAAVRTRLHRARLKFIAALRREGDAHGR